MRHVTVHTPCLLPIDAVAFWLRVGASSDDECWEWQGPLDRDGYGHYMASIPGTGRQVKLAAHRVAFFLEHGRYPSPGLVLDHLCRNRGCVNPAHLDEVTQGENGRRGEGRSVAFAQRTHCDKGHPLDGDNLATRVNGGRKCRRCHREYVREWRRSR